MIVSNDICAVITTFHPESSFRSRIEVVLKQVGYIVVINDSGSDTFFDTSFDGYKNITYLKNKSNLGIAKSLNKAINQAIKIGYRWILTLDDDTLISATYTSELLNFYNTTKIENIGIISLSRNSTINSEDDGKQLVCSNKINLKRSIITSGSFFNSEVFEEVQGFDDSFFIDLVDFDFCTKLRKKNYKIIQLSKIGMKHKVGNSRIYSIFGFHIVIYNHLPFRLYYQIRNSLAFSKKHICFEPILSIYILFDIFRLPIKAILFENQKKIRIKYLFYGLWDSLRGKMGKVTVDF